MIVKTWQQKSTEVKDYTLDWTDELGTDTISTSTWTVTSGITKDSSSNTTKTATVWLSAATAGSDHTATNTIVTAAGRTLVRAIVIEGY